MSQSNVQMSIREVFANLSKLVKKYCTHVSVAIKFVYQLASTSYIHNMQNIITDPKLAAMIKCSKTLLDAITISVLLYKSDFSLLPFKMSLILKEVNSLVLFTYTLLQAQFMLKMVEAPVQLETLMNPYFCCFDIMNFSKLLDILQHL